MAVRARRGTDAVIGHRQVQTAAVAVARRAIPRFRDCDMDGGMGGVPGMRLRVSRQRPRSVFARIRQRLLYYAECADRAVRAERFWRRPAKHCMGHRHRAGSQARLRDETGDCVISHIRGHVRAVRGVRSILRHVEHSEQLVHVMLSVGGLASDGLHGASRHRKVLRSRVTSRVCLHDNRGERVRHHVMHVAGDARAFTDRGLPLRILLCAFQYAVVLAQQRGRFARGTPPQSCGYRDDDADADGDDAATDP